MAVLTTASAQYYFTPSLSFTAKFAGEFAPTAQTYAGSGTAALYVVSGVTPLQFMTGVRHDRAFRQFRS